MINVVAAVISDGNKYLICKRPAHKRHGGMWEFPGGKMEPAETFSGAIKREMKEELDLDVTGIGKIIASHSEPDSEYIIHFVETYVIGEITLHEHEDATWISPTEFESFTMAPMDQKFVTERVL